MYRVGAQNSRMAATSPGIVRWASNCANSVRGPCGGAPRTGRPSALVQCARIGISHLCASPRAGSSFRQNFGLSWMAAWKPRHHGPTSMAPWASRPKIGAKRRRRLAQRCGQRVMMLGRGGERGVFLGIAVVDGVPGHAEQWAEPAERFVGGWPGDDGGDKTVEHGDAVSGGLALAWCAQPAIEFVERHRRPRHAGCGRRRVGSPVDHAAAFTSCAARVAFHSHGNSSCS